MGRQFAISDIHGQYKSFMKMMDAIHFSNNDTLYILGDIIDRGPDSLKIYDEVIKHPNMKLIMGNHEEMMVDCFTNDTTIKSLVDAHQLWLENGGGTTEQELFQRPLKEQEQIIRYFASLPYYEMTNINNRTYILCHARPYLCGIGSIENELQTNIDNETILWDRRLYEEPIPQNIYIIHGHTPVQFWTGKPFVINYNFGQVYNIDCGAANADTLACICLNDLFVQYIKI